MAVIGRLAVQQRAAGRRASSFAITSQLARLQFERYERELAGGSEEADQHGGDDVMPLQERDQQWAPTKCWCLSLDISAQIERLPLHSLVLNISAPQKLELDRYGFLLLLRNDGESSRGTPERADSAYYQERGQMHRGYRHHW